MFTLYCLATNPDKQDKVRAELKKLMAPGEPVTDEILSKIPYLNAAIKEAFRYSF